MKKKFLALCIFTFSLFTLSVSAENQVTAPEQELPVDKPSDTGPIDTLPQKRSTWATSNFTEEEIVRILELQDQYFAAKENEIRTGKFKEVPKTGDGEYSLGEFKEETLDNATDYLNYLRNLAYMPPVDWTQSKVDFTQYGAVGMAAIRMQSHYINDLAEKPADMSNDFWAKAGQSTLASCIHSSRVEESLIYHLDAYMYDYGVTNAPVGHRAYLLSRRYTTLGFGYAQTTPIISGQVNYYTGTSHQNQNANTVSDDFITSWPSAGVFPTNQMFTDLRWSVHLNNSGYGLNEDNVKVVLKNNDTNETWEFSNANADGEFTLANSYGYRTIVFQPENISYAEGQEFTVTVTGITGKSNSYSYTTKLFNMNGEYSIPNTGYVKNEKEFQEALDNEDINKIIIANDIQLTKPLEVKRSVDITANKKITVISGESSRHMNIIGKDIELNFLNSMVTLDGNEVSGGINSASKLLILKNAIIKKCYSDTNGGGLFTTKNSSLIIEESIFSDNSTDQYKDGGAIYTDSNTTAVLKGKTKIYSNNARSGGGIYVDGILEIENSKIFNNTASSYAGGIFITGIDLIKDCEVYDNIAKNSLGGGVYINGSITLKDSKISGNSANTSGGGVSQAGPSDKFILNGGEISNNTASNGGGIFVQGVFEMIDGTIYENTATSGGGVDSRNTFTMIDGTISNNKSSQYGGGIYTTSIFTMKNGKISENITDSSSSSAGNGGGIYQAGSNSVFTMEAGEISNNMATGKGGGVFLLNKDTFIVKGGKIHDNTSPYGGGVYNLGTLTIEKGLINNNKADYGGGICNYSNSYFEMINGEINNNDATKFGGGVYIYSPTSTFEMQNGKISNNTAKDGGGVCTYSNGTFIMSNGEISQNRSLTSNGGGVHISSGEFTLNGGTISNNISDYCGGGVYMTTGEFNMNGGKISSNTSNYYGGGVYLLMGEFIMKKGEISSNISSIGGGAFISSKAHLMEEGGSIANNTAIDVGNNIYYQ